jgi:hypothetical protein
MSACSLTGGVSGACRLPTMLKRLASRRPGQGSTYLLHREDATASTDFPIRPCRAGAVPRPAEVDGWGSRRKILGHRQGELSGPDRDDVESFRAPGISKKTARRSSLTLKQVLTTGVSPVCRG